MVDGAGLLIGMAARTQIGGKYTSVDASVFLVRRRLLDVGVDVIHPTSGGIVCTIDGRGYTFDPRIISYLDVETNYYHAIATSHFHTVSNRFQTQRGYIGASAALEMAYAMVHFRPILLMHCPVLSPSVDPLCASIIDKRKRLLRVRDMFSMTDSEIVEVVRELLASAEQGIDYGISDRMRYSVIAQVDRLFQQIRADERGRR